MIFKKILKLFSLFILLDYIIISLFDYSKIKKFGIFLKNILCSFYFLNHFRKINELFLKD